MVHPYAKIRNQSTRPSCTSSNNICCNLIRHSRCQRVVAGKTSGYLCRCQWHILLIKGRGEILFQCLFSRIRPAPCHKDGWFFRCLCHDQLLQKMHPKNCCLINCESESNFQNRRGQNNRARQIFIMIVKHQPGILPTTPST